MASPQKARSAFSGLSEPSSFSVTSLKGMSEAQALRDKEVSELVIFTLLKARKPLPERSINVSGSAFFLQIQRLMCDLHSGLPTTKI